MCFDVWEEIVYSDCKSQKSVKKIEYLMISHRIEKSVLWCFSISKKSNRIFLVKNKRKKII